jgi:L-lactate dehydrogenase (cytochrome)
MIRQRGGRPHGSQAGSPRRCFRCSARWARHVQADARKAVDHGADAVVVSNRGGRQLDGAPSSIRVLPEIIDAVGGRTEVYLDGGIRSGQDILKALALGAKLTFIDRAFLYGLGAGGEAGVTRALEILRRELDVTMALCGERDIKNVGARNIYRNGPLP